MARLPRFVIPGHPPHVILRGNRSGIFCAEADYRFYLDKQRGLRQASLQYACVCVDDQSRPSSAHPAQRR